MGGEVGGEELEGVGGGGAVEFSAVPEGGTVGEGGFHGGEGLRF